MKSDRGKSKKITHKSKLVELLNFYISARWLPKYL